MVGLQVEDGLRVEWWARADTGERELKRIMWKELKPPNIRNACDEDEERYTIIR
jgi:hypothetical protein